MNLTAGAELDAEVAKACGIEGKILHHPFAFDRNGPVFVKFLVNNEGSWPAIWQPSTDLNAAFEAAEKVGLFDSWMLEKVRFDEKVWWSFSQVWYRYEEDEPDMDEDEEFGYNCRSFDGIGPGEPTPALAICAAILALSKKNA